MTSTLRALAAALVSGSALAATLSLAGGCTGRVLELPDGGQDAGLVEGSVRDAARDHAADAGGRDAPGDAAPAGSACLVDLSVQSTAGGSLALVPAFSPTTFDYSVRCSAGSNPVTVTLTACEGAKGELLQPTSSAPAPHTTVTFNVTENQAIVAAASTGTATTEYWVRCLPQDFPELSMNEHPSAGTPPPGYYLVGNDSTPPAAVSSYAIVLDGNGVPVWYHSAGTAVFDVDHLQSGELSFFSQPKSGWSLFQLMPLEEVSLAPKAVTLGSEDLRRLANGNYVGISSPLVKGVDLTGLTVPLPDGGTDALGTNGEILDCDLVEFTPTGKIVWMWRASDHFDPAKDTTYPELVSGVGSGQVLDAFGCDSIDVDPKDGNLLVSAKNMDSVFYLDRASGEVLWKMGGATYSKDGATYVPVADPFFLQHDARLLPGWSTCGGGQISVFDDETSRPVSSRGVVYDVTVGACDAGAPGASVAWQYEGRAASLGSGSFRVLADGSRVIGWGNRAKPRTVFTEVDAKGHDLLDFSFGAGEWSDRAIKVPLSAFDLEVLRETAGLP